MIAAASSPTSAARASGWRVRKPRQRTSASSKAVTSGLAQGRLRDTPVVLFGRTLSGRWSRAIEWRGSMSSGHTGPRRWTSHKCGKRAFEGRLGKDRSPRHSRHSPCEREIRFTALSGPSVSRKISRIPRSRGFCQAGLSFEFDAGKLVEEGYVDGIFVSRILWGVISEGVLTPRGAKAGASVVIPAIRPSASL